MTTRRRRTGTLGLLPALLLTACATSSGCAPREARAPGPWPDRLEAQVVRGAFVLRPAGNATSPDGDTVRFRADRPELLCDARGRCPRAIGGGTVLVRFASIDALELSDPCAVQRLPLALAARDRLLSALGFAEVGYGTDGTHVARAAPEAARATLLVTGLDGRGGRPTAYVLAGDPPEPDGTRRPVTAADVRASANHALLRDGLAYPLYYADGVSAELLPVLDAAVRAARDRRQGVWAEDATASFPIPARGDDVRALAVWPEISRALCRCAPRDGCDLRATLAAWPPGPVWLRGAGRRAAPGDVVRVEGGRVEVRSRPEDLVRSPRAR